MGADRTLLQIVGIGGAYFLLGEPGGGKTVSERHAAWHLLEKLQLDDAKAAERTVSDPDARIPLYLRLPDWVRNGGSPDLESLVRHTLLPLPNLNDESRTRIVKLLQNETRRLVLLLDGWDEIPSDGDGIERARNLVKALVETQEQPHAIVVACRFAARPDPLAEVTELRVLRLDRPEQVAVLARWLARGATPEPDADAVAEAQRVLEHIDRQPGTLRNLLRTPLYLGLLGLVLTPEGTDTRTPDLKQIHRRHEFLHEVICKLLTNGHRRRPTKPEEGAQNDWLRRQLRVLRELAFIMLCDGVLEVDYEDLKARLLELDETHSDRLRGEFESAGILRPNSRAEPSGRWAFQHRSLLEALAGQHLAAYAALSRTQDQLSARDGLREQRRSKALQSIGDLRKHQKRKSEDPARFWVEPFSLAAGYVGKDAESWIRWLLQHDELRPIGLAAVALADSEHVGADLLLDVLEKNRDVDWEERRVVYESLLPPLGRGFDPAVRQALLKFVAHERETEDEWRIDRGELWFVDQVFIHVAEDQAQPVDVRQIAESQRRELMRAVGARHLPEKIVGMLLELPRSVSKGRDSDSYWRFVPARAARLDESAQRARTHAGERARDGRVHNGHANDFWVAEVHVTDSFWGLFAGTSRACTTDDARRSEPATGVNWYQATMFARWLTVLLGDAGSPAGTEVSLPTAWEWDLTARWHPDNLSREAARQDPPHGWAIVATPATSDGTPVETMIPVTADSLDANFGKRRPEPGPCGSPARRHNPLGLRDMIRFLWTWCKDTPRSIGSSDRRILRGGSCNSLARLCAIDFQDTNAARRSSRYCGIRLSMHRTQNLASCCACGHGDNHD